MSDYRDLAIEHLAADEAAALDLAAAYRAQIQAALALLHARDGEIVRLREMNARLRAELAREAAQHRALREQTVRRAIQEAA